jgi:hypothetical protein
MKDNNIITIENTKTVIADMFPTEEKVANLSNKFIEITASTYPPFKKQMDKVLNNL